MSVAQALDYAEYESVDAVRWSCLREMRRSPKHYRWRLDHPPADTDYFRLGRAVHCAVLEPDRFPLEVAVFTGKIRRGKEWDAFSDVNAARTILKADEYAMCLAIRDAVRAHPVAKHLLEVGEAEKSIVWTDPRTGLLCKGRVDWLNSMVVDLKTDAQLSPRRFPVKAARNGYACQMAMYREGLRVLGMDPPVKILAVESVPPFDVGVFALDENALWAGEEEVHELMDKVAECTTKNAWPGMFGDDEKILDLPAWAFPDEEDVSGMGLTAAGEP